MLGVQLRMLSEARHASLARRNGRREVGREAQVYLCLGPSQFKRLGGYYEGEAVILRHTNFFF